MIQENWPQLSTINWLGLWPRGGWPGRLQATFSYTIVLCTPLLFATEGYGASLGINQGNLVVVMQRFNEMISGILFYLHSLVFIFYRTEIKKTLTLIDDLNEDITREDGDMAFEEILKRKTFNKKVYKMFLTMFIFLAAPWSIFPLAQSIINNERILLVNVWVPLDNNFLPFYIIQFLFQVLCGYNYSLSLTMFNALFVSVCELIFGHLSILCLRVRKIQYGLPSTNLELIRSIQHQNRILEIIHKFQGITMLLLIADCILTIVLVCCILVELTKAVPGSEGRVFSVILEALSVLMFLGTYCWYGNQITYQYSQVVSSWYSGDWYNGTKDEKKILLNAMTMTRRPVYLGGFIRIDTLTFINIIKGAFSFYNVLMAEKKIPGN
uniref:Odorant receptor n=1 Tax=Yemma signatus TaxID=300820 RepID=A0A385H549_9HEMI|nr:odorant receptor [Yemma signatus]